MRNKPKLQLCRRCRGHLPFFTDSLHVPHSLDDLEPQLVRRRDLGRPLALNAKLDDLGAGEV